jgi:hypothetical protein
MLPTIATSNMRYKLICLGLKALKAQAEGIGTDVREKDELLDLRQHMCEKAILMGASR